MFNFTIFQTVWQYLVVYCNTPIRWVSDQLQDSYHCAVTSPVSDVTCVWQQTGLLAYVATPLHNKMTLGQALIVRISFLCPSSENYLPLYLNLLAPQIHLIYDFGAIYIFIYVCVLNFSMKMLYFGAFSYIIKQNLSLWPALCRQVYYIQTHFKPNIPLYALLLHGYSNSPNPSGNSTNRCLSPFQRSRIFKASKLECCGWWTKPPQQRIVASWVAFGRFWNYLLVIRSRCKKRANSFPQQCYKVWVGVRQGVRREASGRCPCEKSDTQRPQVKYMTQA